MGNKTPKTHLLSSENGNNPREVAIGHSARSTALSEMLTARELEALLMIDVKTIYMYVQKGLIPYVRIQSNIRFRRDEILDWITQQSFDPRG
jgi:excisionase family DNA binding protein